jgi:glutaredoxin 3
MDSTAHKVIVYSTDPCSFCARVKGILDKRGVEFVEVNLTKDPAGRVELVQKTGMMSFPQVVVGDHLVGGFNELLAAEQDGRLDELLADSGTSAEQPPPAPAA